jgi:hypothetical protein
LFYQLSRPVKLHYKFFLYSNDNMDNQICG